MKNDSQFNKAFRRHKIRDIIGKTATIAREAFNIYSSLKRGDPISIALGVASAYGTVDKVLSKSSGGSFQEVLLKAGYVQVCEGMERLVVSQMRNLSIPPQFIARQESGVSQTLERFDMDDDNFLYSILPSNSSVPYLYAANPEIFIKFLDKLTPKFLKITRITEKDYYSRTVTQELCIPTETYKMNDYSKQFLVRAYKLFEHGFNRSALLIGPPGTGKTSLAAKYAEILGGRLVLVEHSILNAMTYTHVPLIEILSILNPAVILLDDVDRVGESLNSLLGNLEQLNRSGERRLILGTANNISNISQAARRPGRFDELIEFSLPDRNERIDLIKSYCEYQGTRISQSNIEKLADSTNGFSHAHIREIAIQASVRDIEELIDYVHNLTKLMTISEKKEEVKK